MPDQDLRGTVKSIVEAALKTGLGKSAEKATKIAFGDVVAAVVGEAVGVGAGAIAGLVLKVILRTVDENQQKVDRLFSEPFLTGCCEAKTAIQDAVCVTSGDFEERDRRLNVADASLAKAETLAAGDRDSWRKMSLIHLVRGLIALELRSPAPAFAAVEFQRVLDGLTPQRDALAAEVSRSREIAEWCDRHPLTANKYMDGGGYDREIVLMAEQVANMDSLIRFASAQREVLRLVGCGTAVDGVVR